MRARLVERWTAITVAAGLVVALPAHAAQGGAPTACDRWQECRRLALDARDRGEFDRFYDLAWRAVQTGPNSDPDLLYLLARAQSLNGRPRDALVMLSRLVESGAARNARTEPDFDRARSLPGWQELEARLLSAVAPVAAAAEPDAARLAPFAPVPPVPPVVRAAPAPRVLPGVAAAAIGPPIAMPPAPLRRFDLRPGDEVSRFVDVPFVAGGLAWDGASRRFLLGDAHGRRVMVVGEGRDRPDDLVRGASAQFHDVIAFEIDATRGDLWVVSTDASQSVVALHRLQLISGRALGTFEPPAAPGGARVIDLGITAGGSVVMLDASGPQLLLLRPGGRTIETLMALDVAAPTSLAVGRDDRTVFVAHRDGIVRLDLQARTATRVMPPRGVTLGGFARLRWHQSGLVGVQAQADGTTHVVRLPLDRAGAATEAVVLEVCEPGAFPSFAVVAGDDLFYLLTGTPEPAAGRREAMVVVVRRLRLTTP